MQKQIRSLLLFKKRIFVWDIWENLMNTLYEIGTMSKTKLKRNDILKDHKCVRYSVVKKFFWKLKGIEFLITYN